MRHSRRRCAEARCERALQLVQHGDHDIARAIHREGGGEGRNQRRAAIAPRGSAEPSCRRCENRAHRHSPCRRWSRGDLVHPRRGRGLEIRGHRALRRASACAASRGQMPPFTIVAWALARWSGVTAIPWPKRPSCSEARPLARPDRPCGRSTRGRSAMPMSIMCGAAFPGRACRRCARRCWRNGSACSAH